MNSRNILAALVGAVVSFLMGGLVYGLFLMDYLQSNSHTYEGLMKPESEAMVGYVIGSLIQSILFCYIFVASGVKSLAKGAVMGAILMLLIGLWMGLFYVTAMNWYTSIMAFIVEVIAGTFMGLVIGAAIGWMLGRGSKETA